MESIAINNIDPFYVDSPVELLVSMCLSKFHKCTFHEGLLVSTIYVSPHYIADQLNYT